MNLRILDTCESIYSVPQDNLVEDVMIPALQVTTNLRCMVGFFNSAAFSELAPGLAYFLNETKENMRLLACPSISSKDHQAISEAVTNPEQVIEDSMGLIIDDARINESALIKHHYQCLAYLLASKRLEIRFVLMNDMGTFHPKVWLFSDNENVVALQGSSNFSKSGLIWNHEMVRLERPWVGGDALETVSKIERIFEALWDNRDSKSLTVDLPEAIRLKIVSDGEKNPIPTVEDFWEALKIDGEKGLVSLPEDKQLIDEKGLDKLLKVPMYLRWQDGPFMHQGNAVFAWEKSDMRRGILAMATGSGKTITALIAAARLQDHEQRLLVVIAAPYKPLISQWEDDVRRFDVEPVALSRLTGSALRRRTLEAIRSLELEISRVEVLVITHDFLTNEDFKDMLKKIPAHIKTFLIADEVHNLGRRSFVNDAPERFDFRLGLSATPERQYDPEGTDELLSFFGPIVYRYGLAEAIGVCLVPYDYHIHTVKLLDIELEDWLDLTDKLRQANFYSDEGDPRGDSSHLSSRVEQLLRDRRKIIECAAQKVSVLKSILEKRNRYSISHTLIYASDKQPDQLKEVNRLLSRELRLVAHQLTAQESSDKSKTAALLDDFAKGDIQVITCKRVLDEGVNIPQVSEAFLLASNTVERQWIQRRGRILRKCDEILKEKAILHDFIVIPSDLTDQRAKTIVRQELKRAMAFAELADNAGSPNGPFAVINKLSV